MPSWSPPRRSRNHASASWPPVLMSCSASLRRVNRLPKRNRQDAKNAKTRRERSSASILSSSFLGALGVLAVYLLLLDIRAESRQTNLYRPALLPQCVLPSI